MRPRSARPKRSKRPSLIKTLPVTTAPSLVTGGGDVVIFEAPDGRIQLDVRLERETVWLTQAQMAELFGRERSVITKHLRNVFLEGELAEKSNVQNLHIASSDKPVVYYNLDEILRCKGIVDGKRKGAQGTLALKHLSGAW